MGVCLSFFPVVNNVAYSHMDHHVTVWACVNIVRLASPGVASLQSNLFQLRSLSEALSLEASVLTLLSTLLHLVRQLCVCLPAQTITITTLTSQNISLQSWFVCALSDGDDHVLPALLGPIVPGIPSISQRPYTNAGPPASLSHLLLIPSKQGKHFSASRCVIPNFEPWMSIVGIIKPGPVTYLRH